MDRPPPTCRPVSRDPFEIQVIKTERYLESNNVIPNALSWLGYNGLTAVFAYLTVVYIVAAMR